MNFNFSKHWGVNFFGFYDFKRFYEFASNKETQTNHYNRLGAVHVEENGEISYVDMPKELLSMHIDSIDASLNVIKNQILVYLFTRYEFIVQDFIKCLLCNSPDKLIKILKVYPDYHKYLGFSLNEFIEHETKEDYIKLISERISSRMLSGKPSKVMKRLKCISSFDEIMPVNLLDELMVKRNQIVHDGHSFDISLEKLEEFYNSIDKFLHILARAMKKEQVCVVDNSGLLLNQS